MYVYVFMHFVELLGTPGYLAPEMLQVSVGNPDYEGYGKEIDLWVTLGRSVCQLLNPCFG